MYEYVSEVREREGEEGERWLCGERGGGHLKCGVKRLACVSRGLQVHNFGVLTHTLSLQGIKRLTYLEPSATITDVALQTIIWIPLDTSQVRVMAHG